MSEGQLKQRLHSKSDEISSFSRGLTEEAAFSILDEAKAEFFNCDPDIKADLAYYLENPEDMFTPEELRVRNFLLWGIKYFGAP